MRTLGVLLCLLPGLVRAEAGFLASRGRLDPRLRVEVFGGPRSFGLGLTRTDRDQREAAAAGEAHAGLSGEVAWFVFDRVAEARVARVWQLTRARAATLSIAVGGTGILVPTGSFDLGAGPEAALTLGLGGRVFQVDVAVQAGAELFIRAQTARFPLRLQLGITVLPGDFSVSALMRIGVDAAPKDPLVFRGELALALGWLGF